jgi:hypothetical protein
MAKKMRAASGMDEKSQLITHGGEREEGERKQLIFISNCSGLQSAPTHPHPGNQPLSL